MKLQAQYNRIAIVSSAFVLLLGGIGYFVLLYFVLLEQLDQALLVEEAEIFDHVQKYHALPEATIYKDQRISYSRAKEDLMPYFTSRQIYIPEEHRTELSRQLVFPVRVKDQLYAVTIIKSQETTEKLAILIALITLGLIVLLGTVLFLANRFLLKTLWKPFHTTLAAIKDFDLTAPAPISVAKTTIDEFKGLNESVRLMTEKVIRDYQSLKDFTDHASHEMQTPLAVINSKLDLFIQDPHLTEHQLMQVQSIYNAAEKLSRLSGSLLLLAKIGNNQFREVQPVCIRELVRHKVSELDEWMHSKDLVLEMNLHPLTAQMDGHLAEILINNLLSNAIRHSARGSTIQVAAGNNVFSVSNSGTEPLNKLQIFDRFYKSDQSEGTGLGLAIARQICDQYGFRLHYDFDSLRHRFSVHF
ncbi:HAMP domain-containing sensor histidine kinase [Paraflavisolibacter sp. H34]|uniref:sensor histidine kinase n=1 Tax=Huijunlia imazamoxiresistens TaxID=3127457 RepID=UPI00301A34D2